MNIHSALVLEIKSHLGGRPSQSRDVRSSGVHRVLRPFSRLRMGPGYRLQNRGNQTSVPQLQPVVLIGQPCRISPLAELHHQKHQMFH